MAYLTLSTLAALLAGSDQTIRKAITMPQSDPTAPRLFGIGDELSLVSSHNPTLIEPLKSALDAAEHIVRTVACLVLHNAESRTEGYAPTQDGIDEMRAMLREVRAYASTHEQIMSG